jgi:hypothetical protein
MTVKGLTIPEAADPWGTSSSIAKALKGMVVAYCPQDPESSWRKLTLFPTHS